MSKSGGRGRQKKSKTDGATSAASTPVPKAKWEPPSGSWEDHVVSVDTMEKDPVDNTISAYLMWADGHRSLHPSKVVHQKCPQKVGIQRRCLRNQGVGANDELTPDVTILRSPPVSLFVITITHSVLHDLTQYPQSIQYNSTKVRIGTTSNKERGR